MHVSAWNIALQVVNFLVLAWLLQRFLWKPVARVIAKRRAEVEAQLGAATAQLEEAHRVEAQYNEKIAALAARREGELSEARRRGEEEAQRIREEAERKASELAEKARAELAEERARALAGLRGQAIDLAVSIAERLLREAAPPRDDSFLKKAVESIDAPEQRRLLARQLDGGRVTVVSASPLGDEQVRDLRAFLGAIAGRPVTAELKVDAALLAGVELRFPETILRFNWQASLAQIRATLEDGGGAR